jgi:outer membrane protein OmpA-like peptidoglycan-associated protein
VQETIYFLPNDAGLTESARTALESLADKLSEDHRLTISGHCALAGTERGRIDLSMQRAQATLDYLLGLGWRPSERPVVAGRGGAEPVTLDPDRQYLNRRVEISSTGS